MTEIVMNQPEPTAPVMLLGANATPDDVNYAADADALKRFMDTVFPVMGPTRNLMTTLHSQWTRQWLIWNGKHQFRLYNGRSDLRIPVTRKTIDSITSQVVANLYPSHNSFVALPDTMNPAALMSADANERLIAFDVRQAKLGQKLPEFVRDGLIFGTGILKCDWKRITMKRYQRQALNPEVANAMQAQGTVQPGLQGVTFGQVPPAPGASGPLLYEGPNVTNVDILRWFIHPFTVREICDARLIFHDTDSDLTFIRQQTRQGRFVTIDEAKLLGSAGGKSTVSDGERDSRLAPYGLSLHSVPNYHKDTYRLEEGYCKFDLYGTGEEIDCKFTLCGQNVLELRQNPFFWQQPPYFTWRYQKNKDLFFGSGLVEVVEDLQYMTDAIANQAIDSAVLQSMPIMAMDSSRLDQDESTYRMAPGAQWKFNGNPEEIVKIISFPDTSNTGFTTVNLLGGIIQDVASMPPIAQGKLANRDTTATEAKIVEAGASSGITSLGTVINEDAMTPLVNWMYMLEGQSRRVDSYLNIAGTPPIPLRAQDLCLNMSLHWITKDMIEEFVQSAALKQEAKMANEAGMAGMMQGGMQGGPMGAPQGAEGGPMGGQSQGPMASMPGQAPSQGFNSNGM